MRRTILLVPRRWGRQIILEGKDTRPLRKSGSSIVTSYSKDFFDYLGLLNDDELVDVDVEQRYEIRFDENELIVEQRIPIPDDSVLEDLAVESPKLVADGGESQRNNC